MTDKESTSETESNRSLLARMFLWVLQTADETREEIGKLAKLNEEAHSRLNSRLINPTRALAVMVAVTITFTQSALAQEGAGEVCGEGFGLLIFDIQMMAWQLIVGLLFVIALIGLVLRAFPIFTGATAMGNLMLLGVIVGVIAFIFLVQFIDIAFGYVGGPGVGEGCTPFL